MTIANHRNQARGCRQTTETQQTYAPLTQMTNFAGSIMKMLWQLRFDLAVLYPRLKNSTS